MHTARPIDSKTICKLVLWKLKLCLILWQCILRVFEGVLLSQFKTEQGQMANRYKGLWKYMLGSLELFKWVHRQGYYWWEKKTARSLF